MDVSCRAELTDTKHLFLTGDRLSFQKDSSEHRLTFPARPCEDFVSKINLEDTKVVVVPQEHNHDDIAKLVVDKKIVPDFSFDKGAKYNYFPVHAGVFAVTEVFTGVFDYSEEVSASGIYFFAYHGRKMLRHLMCSNIGLYSTRVIISRPMELWVLTCSGVNYFGFSRRDDVFREDSIAERLDPAFWMAGTGDMQGAVDLFHSAKAQLEQTSLIAGWTLLHYAAMEGDAPGVSLLLEKGFDSDCVDSEDSHGRTPLHMAVAGLHLDAVVVLLDEGGANPVGESLGSCLTDIGYFMEFRPDSTLKERVDDEIERIVPEIVQRLLKADPCVVNCVCSYIGEKSILSSPKAVKLICEAEESEPDICSIAMCFQSFRTRTQELSAVNSLLLLVQEFELDINSEGDDDHDERPIVSLVSYGCAEVVIMAIQYLGADPTSTSKDGRSLRQIVAQRDPNADTQRILDFLGSIGV